MQCIPSLNVEAAPWWLHDKIPILFIGPFQPELCYILEKNDDLLVYA